MNFDAVCPPAGGNAPGKSGDDRQKAKTPGTMHFRWHRR